MNDRQKNLLLHMTGLDRAPDVSRKYFAASPDTDDYRELKALVELGLVTPPVSSRTAYPNLMFFYTTEPGIEEAKRLSLQGTDSLPAQ